MLAAAAAAAMRIRLAVGIGAVLAENPAALTGAGVGTRDPHPTIVGLGRGTTGGQGRTPPDRFPSRAAALRAAVHDWLSRRRQAEIDSSLERGYADVPEDIAMTQGLATSARQALTGSDLDW